MTPCFTAQPAAVAALFLAALLPGSAPAAEPFQEVSFPSSDGLRIYANLYGEGDHGVVLAHGAIFNKESWDPLARRLAAAGLRVLAIDFRGYGRSGKPSRKTSRKAKQTGSLHFDVLGAIEYLRESGASRISVLGGSMGGGAAATAVAATKPGEIDGLILLAHAPTPAPSVSRDASSSLSAKAIAASLASGSSSTGRPGPRSSSSSRAALMPSTSSRPGRPKS